MAPNDEEERRRQHFFFNAIVAAATILLRRRRRNYIPREPCRTSALTGSDWVAEVLRGHPDRCIQIFRMKKEIFRELCVVLRDRYGLHGSNNIQIPEMVGMFLFILGQNAGNRLAQERFQHSGETVSRIFHHVLDCVYRMSTDIIKPRENQLNETPAKILNDDRYRHGFKNCIGALDGTHIPAVVKKEERGRFYNRKGITSQNVLAVCDFDMLYIFVSAGWEGSAHDMRVFQHAISTPGFNFPRPPEGKYYLVDAGYPNKTGYLSPYKGERYHLPEFQSGSRATGPREVFNQAHSSLRSVIERTFGVTKKKWPILTNMPSYAMQTQAYIVLACMALHNFIRFRVATDEEFVGMDDDGAGTSSPSNDDGADEAVDNADLRDDTAMGRVRDRIADKLYSRRQTDRR